MEYYKFNSAVHDSVAVGATSTKVLEANSGRNYACLTNNSNETIFVSYGVAAVQDKGHRLNAGGGVLEITHDMMWTGAIYAICASGSKKLATVDAS